MSADTVQETQTRWVQARPVDAEAFAPFGRLISASGERKAIDLYGDAISVYSGGPIDADVPVEFLVVASDLREFRVKYLERHALLAQSFFILGGASFIICVAPAEAELTETGLPALDELRAFLVPGDCGVTLHRNVWHEPPFPLSPHSVRITTTHGKLTDGLEAELDAAGGIAKGDVDKRDITERTGAIVRIALP